MKRIFFLISIVLVSILSSDKTNGQSLPVGTPVLDNYYRRQQLLGTVDSNLSFVMRPLNISQLSPNISDTPSNNYYTSAASHFYFANKKGEVQLLPLTWQQQFNSHHPYGWNDGAMIPSKGYQTMISAGVYLKLGFLSIQFRPEFVYAANNSFDGFASGHSNIELVNYYAYHNDMDVPERYGTNPYHKMFWGQSNITLTLGPVAVAASNENIWWGPGIKNALLLSNNAPGFKHVSVKTVRPLKTYIGSFGVEMIAAKLDSSGFNSLTVSQLQDGTQLVAPKKNDWRYYTGFNLSYQPKWIPGLTVGLIRVFNAYHSDVKAHGLSGYLPFFTAYSKQNTDDGDGGIGDPFPRDQLTSFYARYLLPKAQAEIYLEYGLNDNSYNIQDFIGSPQHSRAYTFGLQKMIPFGSRTDQHILFGGEITQLSQTPDRLVRDAGGWYLHGQVRGGQTNLGQILGSGTGSGGNIQTFDLSWVSGLKKLGLTFERYEHDVDFQQGYLPDYGSGSRRWVDLAFGAVGEWNYKNLLFNLKLQEIKSLNYQWILKDYNPSQYYIPHNDVYNFHGELGIAFRF